MRTLSFDHTSAFVKNGISSLHESRLKSLQSQTLSQLLAMDSYLLRTERIFGVGELINRLLDVSLSQAEDKIYSDFLKDLVLFVVSQTFDGRESTTSGVDIEFEKKGALYIVSVMSGTKWRNSSQQNKLADDLRNAVIRLKQSQHGKNVQPVLGICYGKPRTNYLRGYLQVVGRDFWYLISENENLYTDIVEPIGYRTREHNETFDNEKSRVENKFTREFIEKFCTNDGSIDWVRLVEFNSGNYDLDKILS